MNSEAKDNRLLSLGKVIREAREEQQISLNQLARWIDVDAAYLSRIERGKVPASIGIIGALADLLGLSFFELLVIAGKVNTEKLLEDERKWLKARIDQGRLIIAIGERKHDIYRDFSAYFAETPRLRILPPKLFSTSAIEEFAENFLNRVREYSSWSFGVPTPIRKIATIYFPLEIVYLDLSAYPKIRAFLDRGKIYLDPEKSRSSYSKNYVIAHELSHWLLQKYENNLYKVAIHKTPAEHSRLEATVNKLAASLLMPRKELINLSRRYNVNDRAARKKLADLFEVPLLSLDFRLASLGLVDRRTLYIQSQTYYGRE